MYNNIETILNQWLEIEYYYIANKLDFIETQTVADDILIKKTIRCLDYVTSNKTQYSDNYIITIIALMWEYSDKNKYNLKDIILKFLSRIGYSTSAIMIDQEYGIENKLFRPSSIIDAITIAAEQEMYGISICGNTFLLTKFQKEIWDKIGSNRCVGISAPTSAGKSFVILLRTLFDSLDKDIDIVYIVPTLSLLNQVTEDYHKYIKRFNLNGYRISSTYSFIEEKKSIYIMTQEKAVSAFSNTDVLAFRRPLIFVVDEIQNIERLLSPTDDRAKVLFDTLLEFSNNSNVVKIIISGPRVEKLSDLGETLFGDETIDLSTNTSPVLNLTYSISLERNKYYFKQYCSINSHVISREIENSEMICGYGKKLYTPDFLCYLNRFVNKIGHNNQNIVFAPTANTARKIATYFAEESNNEGSNNNNTKLDELIDYYSKTINKNYSLCSTLDRGVAYHHGKLPMHVRRTLEKAITNKKIGTIVCTTTLMQGVNLPAQNVIIRNPHLYVSKRFSSEELSAYEMANLRGRAGRLLKDFIGRTYALDESGFIDLAEYEQTTLFEDTYLDLPTGYGEKFENYKDEIKSATYNDSMVDESMSEYGFVVTYIRQTILRHKENATKWLSNVGINYSQEQVAAIMAKLSSLEIPSEICYKNRYWDPYVLNKLYKNCEMFDLPSTPTDKSAEGKLGDILKWLRDNPNTEYIYNKHIPKEYRKGQMRIIMCKNAIDWAREKKLNNLLSGKRYNTDINASENIESTIWLLQNTISYSIPLLLKPIFDMLDPDNIFLLCLQTGAYRKATRRMIEMGIPRETALYIFDKYIPHINLDDKTDVEIEEFIKENINKAYNKIPYWIRVQLDFLQ